MTMNLSDKPVPTFSACFSAMATYIEAHTDEQKQAPLRVCRRKPTSANFRSLGKLLLNAWSAEYALRITPVVNDEQYLQSSLHWTFPQAYYSTLFSSRAFLNANGIDVSNEDLVAKHIGWYVMRGFYPPTLGYYGQGGPAPFNCRLPMVDIPGQDTITKEMETYLLMNEFMSQTRKKQIKKAFLSVQINPRTALRNGDGEVLQTLPATAYKAISAKIGYTTFFSLLSRLRISSTNREIEKLALQEMDVRVFHDQLVGIVSHINQVHETHIIRKIGEVQYRQLVAAHAPSYLQESFVRERMDLICKNEQPA
jgi:hypothetical protein